MKHNILLTGANGFIGAALMSTLEEQGHKVAPLMRSNCDYTVKSIRAELEKHKPDIFIHAAGNASVAQSYEHTDRTKGDTVGLTASVLEAVGRFPTRFVYLSSAAVYGSPEKLPITEQTALAPVSPYGEHKLACENMVQDHALAHPPLIIRIFSLFGAQQHRLVLYELFRQFADPAQKQVRIKGTGLETRDYLSVDIFALKLAALLDATGGERAQSPAVNIASGQHITILECARIMKKILQSPKDIICEGQDMAGNPADWRVDTSLYDQMVKTPISFDFASELSKTLDAWKSQIIP